MKQLKMIYSIIIEIPIFYLGYTFESLWSTFGAGRTTYIQDLQNDDQVNEFLKWRRENKK